MPTHEQLQAFHAAVVQHVQAIQDHVYRPTYFIQVMNERGAYEAACQVIHDQVLPQGFSTLFQANRLDLTIEAFVLQPEWAALFEPQTLRLARDRLAALGYEP